MSIPLRNVLIELSNSIGQVPFVSNVVTVDNRSRLVA
jgi:hypothetical protein